MTDKKVLIVENEVIVSQSMALTLGRKGYQCTAVATGEEAINLLNIFNPHIILMDIGLNGKIDGISTAAIIRQRYSVPIIFITEQENEGIFRHALATGPHNYLNKPYTDAALLQAVQLALELPTQRTIEIPTHFGERVSDGIFVYSDNQYKKVLFRDILYLEAEGMATIMHCAFNKEYRVYVSSNNVVAQLAYPGMVKTSRSYYVNIHQIDSIKNDELIVNNHSVPLSKSYKENVLSRVSRITQK
jgi:two-component system, response regulator PdtaR